MPHYFASEPDRFTGFAPEPTVDRELLTRLITHGAVDPAHLFMVNDDGSDVGRIGLQRHADGTVSTFGWLVDPAHHDLETVHRLLLNGISQAAAAGDIAQVTTTVVTSNEPSPEGKRAALEATGWTVEGAMAELEAHGPAPGETPAGVEEVSPHDDDVITVMAEAMSSSLDWYDRAQVEALGATAAATKLRDSMLDEPQGPWLAHRGENGVDGIAAIERTESEWTLGHLCVHPAARSGGVGATLAQAVLAAAGRAGVPRAAVSVSLDNTPARTVLQRAGFTEWSTSYDYLLDSSGPATG